MMTRPAIGALAPRQLIGVTPINTALPDEAADRLAPHLRRLRLGSVVAQLCCILLIQSACSRSLPDGPVVGRMGAMIATIPSDLIVTGALFGDENVWDPSSRTAHAPESQLSSFDVALDRRALRLAHFAPGESMEGLRDRDRYLVAEVDRRRVPTTDFGIAQRHRDFVVGTMNVRLEDEVRDANGLMEARRPERENGSGFDTNYFSASPAVNITCNKNVMEVPPYSDISTCLEDFALTGVPTGVRTYIKKTDVPNWKRIHDALQRELRALFRPASGIPVLS